MPPFRQPTPSPPPQPVTPAMAAPSLPLASSEGKQVPPIPGSSSSGNNGPAGFEIPPYFVPPPPPREVATGVSNLGNTCYMNAALQALAHAPELCHALDAESHLRRCPTTTTNNGKSKSHRRSNSSSSNGSNGSGKSRRKKKSGGGEDGSGTSGAMQDYDPDYEFCTLCEVERLLGRVHSRPEEILDDPQDGTNHANKGGDNQAGNSTSPPLFPSSHEGPVVPETFVSGFMSKVAPWFRRGVQEDSHEFLRLLIDAMQNSCKGARQHESTSGGGGNNSTPAAEDNEYPFRLFRGTVESNVKCSACRATSCKIDPIEDIGLDILPLKSNNVSHNAPPPYGGGSSTRGAAAAAASMSSSRSTSPNTSHNMALADVQQALERFISSEHLDSGYKCEKCGKLGKATKTSKLASIPPILTLHLKRFRYGTGGVKSSRGGGGYNDNGGSSSTRSSRSARGTNLQPDFDNVGPSGSAKIEGHVPFKTVLDIKPYLTPQLQSTVFQKAICRLFAVVVHSGKNSHSGHYVAYVQNVSKKEWWKMDDAKIVRVPWNEVQNAEAYMLFYRVTSHPVAMRLKSIADAKEEKAKRVVDEIRRREEAKRAVEEAKKAESVAAAKAAAAALQDLVEKSSEDNKVVPDAAPSSDIEDPAGSSNTTSSPASLGKRARPPLASGEEWMRAATTLSPEYLPLFNRIQEFITENVTFSPEFFGYITEEYNRMSSKLSIGRRVKNNKRIKTLLGKGPGGVHPPEDVQGGAEDIQGGILDLFHQISLLYKQKGAGGGGGGGGNENKGFLLPKIEEVEEDAAVTTVKEEKMAKDTTAGATTPVVPEVVPPCTIDNELIIPADNTESYDGAL
ncbi:hypothetical protein ACHAXR_010764 [Thalassiosira sp. AJA248-18]